MGGTDPDNPMLAAALDYAARSWPIFPCRPRGKRPLTEHGLHDATTDPTTIRKWWARWPDANVAIVTGARSGIVVIDIDADHDGETTWETLTAEHGDVATLTALTGGDGLHLIYTLPAVELGNTAGRLGPGIDTRGDGGYIVATPSIHETGQRYEWLDPTATVAPLPAWIIDQLAAPRRTTAPPSWGAAPPPPGAHDGSTTTYALRALEGRCHDITTAAEGTRNHTLNRAAYRLGQLAAGGQIPEHEAADQLAHAARAAGLPDHEAAATIRSGLAAGAQEPQYPDPDKTRPRTHATTRTPPGPSSAAPKPEHPAPPDDLPPDHAYDDEPSDISHHNRTDLGNARRLVAAHGTRIRYVPQWGAWLHWDGQRWARDTTGEIYRLAKHTAEAIFVEALQHPNHDKRKKITEWSYRSEGEARLRAMVAVATTEPGIPVEPDQLDADTWRLNVANGTLDLRTGRLQPHNPRDLITKLAPVAYDPDAHHDTWDRFLDQATGDPDLAAFLARAVGYSLTGDTGEEVLFFIHGPAASGKSTFVDAIESALGDYSKRADFETFLARHDSSGGARSDIARLAGARFVNSVEVDEGARLAEGLVKTLTGGDLITARFLYRDEFEFRPQFKLWLAANSAPKVRHGDQGIWRRILRVPFDHVVAPADRDPQVKATLRDPAAAGPAILAWAVAGCRTWQTRGLAIPDTIRRATDAYRTDMDPLAEFLADHCTFGPGTDMWATAADLRTRYEEWAKEQGMKHTISPQQFRELLEERDCRSDRRRIDGKQVRVWSGVHLLADWETPEDPGTGVSPVTLFDNSDAGEAKCDARDARDAIPEKSSREGVITGLLPTGVSRVSRVTPPNTTTTPTTLCARCAQPCTPSPAALQHGWQTICARCTTADDEPF